MNSQALNGLVIGTGAVEQYGYAPANGGDAQGMDMEMGGEAGSSEYDQQLAWSGRMAHQGQYHLPIIFRETQS